MKLRRLALNHAVRLPTLKHDIDIIEIGPTVPGLVFDFKPDSEVVEVLLSATEEFEEQLVYLMPRDNVAGMEPVRGERVPKKKPLK